MAGRTRARRPSRVGVSVETRQAAEGGERFYARYTDPRGQRHVVKPRDGASTWPDWGEAFTAACLAQAEAQRLSFRSRDGERLLFRDLVRDHYLPSLRDCSPNTRKNTASHLGDGRGLPTRKGPVDQPDGRRLLRRVDHPREAVSAAGDPAGRGRPGLAGAERRGRHPLPRAVDRPDEERVVTPKEWAQIRLQLSGEGTVLLCDLALDCGLRYEEVIALRLMDVTVAHLAGGHADRTWPSRLRKLATVDLLILDDFGSGCSPTPKPTRSRALGVGAPRRTRSCGGEVTFSHARHMLAADSCPVGKQSAGRVHGSEQCGVAQTEPVSYGRRPCADRCGGADGWLWQFGQDFGSSAGRECQVVHPGPAKHGCEPLGWAGVGGPSARGEQCPG